MTSDEHHTPNLDRGNRSAKVFGSQPGHVDNRGLHDLFFRKIAGIFATGIRRAFVDSFLSPFLAPLRTAIWAALGAIPPWRSRPRRAHRIDQANPVSIYRLVAKDTIEEPVLAPARGKALTMKVVQEPLG